MEKYHLKNGESILVISKDQKRVGALKKWIFYTKDTESSLKAWIGHWKHSYEQYLERAVYDYPYDEESQVPNFEITLHFSDYKRFIVKYAKELEAKLTLM